MADTNPYTSTRICEDCGKVIVNVYHAKRFCPECAEKRHRARTAAQRIRNAEERDAAFRADCRAADAAGLSYGKYMLLKNKQACPCANTDKPKR